MRLLDFLQRGHFIYFGYYWAYSKIMDWNIGHKSLEGMIDNDEFCKGPIDYEWHPVQSTSYRLLTKAIKYIYVNEDDVFVDVGCGFGRVISYLIIKKRKCRYIGIDINSTAVRIANERFRKHSHVRIIHDNVLNCIPADATILYLFNPFGSDILDLFLDKAEQVLRNKVKLIYLNSVHKNIFEKHPEWKLRESIMLQPKFHQPIPMLIYELDRDDSLKGE